MDASRSDIADGYGGVEAIANSSKDVRGSTVRTDEPIELRPWEFQLAVIDDDRNNIRADVRQDLGPHWGLMSVKKQNSAEQDYHTSRMDAICRD